MFTLTASIRNGFALRHSPIGLLFLMAFAMPIAFSTWLALLNNFTIEVANFSGIEIGWLQTVREIPGFLAVGVIAVLYLMREQTLAILALVALGAAAAVTAIFPSFAGLLITTLIGSFGFHYYETVNQSLQLQWLEKDRAPQVIGWLVAAGSASSLLAYGLIAIVFKWFGLGYHAVYMAGGGITVAVAFYCWLAYPQYEMRVVQHRKLIFRSRYWLYYALQFMAGARRQIFMVFAAFMMVEHFGFKVHELTLLFLINYAANILFAPMMGWMIARIGEKWSLAFEYAGLIAVFIAYGGIYWFGWGAALAAALYVIDHLFFALAFAQKTYFQKIADPADIAPTAAVALTINHIAAVALPAALGYLWVTSEASVFVLAAILASMSLVLALMIPRHPAPGRETIFSRPDTQKH
ncbi:MAG TPA: MFS transporter [Alphaproteobacteria bacterium]|jgi:predicted MFS family arabinose efflux permease|nr:MAG: MFS transporter [SAR116 cluster bacterium MED-G06]HCV89013.1 MFS transporter [Alphaproteobacteria bacterium]|tara:strand:+ start:4604 stop:5830 length:1227 start_codon:yes stop_codon:yes gene_type:complete